MAKYVHVILKPIPNPLGLRSYAKTVSSSLSPNKSFPNAGPLVAILDKHIEELDKADAAASNREPGAASARRAVRELVRQDLNRLANHVQDVLEEAVGTADLKAIQAMAESAAMDLRKVSPRPKAVFAAKYGDDMGSVALTAPASRKREVHEWQYSTNQETWTFVSSTLQAKTTISGLTVGVPHYFRHRLLTKDGHTKWSDPTIMIVVK